MEKNNILNTLKIAHSPDADDRFMFWPIKEKLINLPENLNFSFFEADTQTLNSLAMADNRPDICAISAIHYKNVYPQYQPLLMGTSLGDGYGPILVSKKIRTLSTREKNPGVLITPGLETTAHSIVKFLGYDFENVKVVSITPMEKIFETLDKYHANGHEVVALLIHEGRLSYSQYKTHSILDIGSEWKAKTGGSLPLGINVIRRDLPFAFKEKIAQLLQESFDYATLNREFYISLCGKNTSPYYSTLSPQMLNTYLDLYANHKTRHLPIEDQEAFKALLNYQSSSENKIPLDWI